MASASSSPIESVFSLEHSASLSAVGMHWMAGLLEHARAAAAFSTPTLNGYKRYRPFSLAPDRAIWGRDNRGVMVRLLGAPGDPATHLENRVGEPSANPYLYMASQVVSRLDGQPRRVAVSGLAARLPALLAEVQQTMFDRARQARDERSVDVGSLDELVEAFRERPVFASAPFCESDGCEVRVKEAVRPPVCSPKLSKKRSAWSTMRHVSGVE